MCGIVGVYGVPKVVQTTIEALYMVDHRGGQGIGVAVSDGQKFLVHRSLGSVMGSEGEEKIAAIQPAVLAVGHMRYGTAGDRDSILNVQPLLIPSPHGDFCIAHNGDTPGDQEEFRAPLLKMGITFNSTTDTEALAQYIATSQAADLERAMLDALARVPSAFALVMATPNALIGCRDPRGFRPLSLGRLDGGWVLASETCAFDMIHAEHVRDIKPGELLWIDQNGPRSQRFGDRTLQRWQCVFELIYFSRPDSIVFGRPVYEFRIASGVQLAKEHPIPTGKRVLVFGVPDSAMFAAEGYARALRRPLSQALIRHHRERTFTLSDQRRRESGVREKFNPIRHRITGKWCYVIDDSIVRGTTMRRLIRMLKQNGAAGVTVLIASPPIAHPCFFGIDMKDYAELQAAIAGGDIDAIREFIGADELHYLSFEGLQGVVGDSNNYCFACFNGQYAFGV